jgi:hypothetical protein
MRSRLFLLPAAILLLAGSTVHGQKTKAPKIQSPAELFPAKTLAYAEIRQPGQLTKEIANLFKGSVLGNVPDSLAKVRAKFKDAPDRVLRDIGPFGLMLAPEVFKELGRLDGAAAALTGISERGEPEFLVVVLPGKSYAPTFLARVFMTVDRVQPIAKVEGVTLYQHYWERDDRFDDKGFRDEKDGPRQKEPRKPVRTMGGPAVAMTPTAVFIGTPDVVKDAIRRAKGKAEGESLAASELFQEARKEAASEPGLFVYANVPATMEMVEGLVKHERHGQQVLAVISKLINPKAFRAVADRLTLSKGTLRYRRTVLLDTKEKSPLLEILPNTPVNSEVLHFVPKNATAAFALSNGNGEKRFARLVEMLDVIIPMLDGRDRELPSQKLQQLEEALKVKLGKDIVGKINNVAIAVGDLMNMPMKKVVVKGRDFESMHTSPQVPVVVIVQGTNEEAAKELAELLPKFVAMMSGHQEPRISTKEIEGQSISSLALGKHESVNFGRQGNTIVLGPFPKPVAQALANGGAKNGLLADPKVAAQVKKLDEPIAVAVAKPITLVMGFFVSRAGSYTRVPAKGIEGKRFEDKSNGEKREAPPEKPEVTVTVEEAPAPLGKEGDKIMKDLKKLLAIEEPLIVSVTRKDDRLQAEASIGGLAPLVSFVTDFAVEQAIRASIARERAWEERRRAEEERRRLDFEKKRELDKK